jgi:hypothetical protein
MVNVAGMTERQDPCATSPSTSMIELQTEWTEKLTDEGIDLKNRTMASRPTTRPYGSLASHTPSGVNNAAISSAL